MAFPAFRQAPSVTVPSGGNTSHNFDIPTTVEIGDLLIAVIASDGNAFSSFSGPGTWTLIHAGSTTTSVDFRVYAKIAEGDEDSGTCTLTVSASETAAGIIGCITASSWYGSLTDGTGIQIGAGSGSTSATDADTESVSAAWGTEDNLWLSLVGVDVQAALTSYPTSYDSLTGPTPHAWGTGNGGGGCAVGMGVRENATTTENPGAWDHGNAGGGWEGLTLCIRPAAAADSTPPTYGTAPALDNRTDVEITCDATATDAVDSTVSHYAVVIANGGAIPSGAQVAAGTDGNDAAALDSGSDTGVSNGAEASITLGGLGVLSPGTAYDVYWTVRDSSLNYATPQRIDVTMRPGPTSATIGTNGTTFTTVFNQNITRDTGHADSDLSFTASGGAVTASYSSGDGSSTFVWTLSRTIQSGETVTYSYVQPNDGLESTPGGVWLPSWTDRSVTNNSTQGGGSGSTHYYKILLSGNS